MQKRPAGSDSSPGSRREPASTGESETATRSNGLPAEQHGIDERASVYREAVSFNCLFLNQLDSVAKVRRLVEFYVEEHSTVLPHSAFRGQTPDEMYLGTGDGVPDVLAARKQDARRRRLAVNRAARCAVCA